MGRRPVLEFLLASAITNDGMYHLPVVLAQGRNASAVSLRGREPSNLT